MLRIAATVQAAEGSEGARLDHPAAVARPLGEATDLATSSALAPPLLLVPQLVFRLLLLVLALAPHPQQGPRRLRHAPRLQRLRGPRLQQRARRRRPS